MLRAGYLAILLYAASSAVFAGTIDARPEWDRPAADIGASWRVRSEIIFLSEDSLETKELERIGDKITRYGFSEVPVLSVALLKEAGQRVKEGRGKEIDTLVDFAGRFSPELPQVGYFHCSLRRSPVGFFTSLGRCLGGLAADFAGFEGRLRTLTNSSRLATIAVAVLASAFFIFLVLTHGGPVAHAWAHRIRGFSPAAVVAVVACLLFMSWICAGWIGPLLLVMLLLWRYMQAAERAAALAVVVLLAALPLAWYAPALYLRYRSGIVPVLESTLRGPSFAAHGAALTRHLADNPSDSAALFALGLIEKRTGRYPDARRLLMKAREADPKWHKPLIALGNLDYLEADVSGAVDRLQLAAQTSPSAFLAHFNLGKIYIKQTRMEEARSALQKAKNISARRFDALDRLSDPDDPQRFLFDEAIDRDELRQRVWAVTPQLRSIHRRFFRGAFPTLSPNAYWALLASVVFLSVISALIRPNRRPPRACEKCGAPSCHLCEPALEHESLCAQCYHAFVRLENLDPDSKKAKERQIGRHRAAREFLERWSSALCPGAHLLFSGSPLMGLLIIGAGAFLFLPVAAPSLWLPHPDAVSAAPDFPWRFAAAAAFVPLYVLTLLHAVRR